MPVQNFSTLDPYTQVYRAILATLKGSPAVTSIARSIPDLSDPAIVNSDPIKEQVTSGDLPELVLMEENWSGVPSASNPMSNRIWPATQGFTVWITTDSAAVGGENSGAKVRLNTISFAVYAAIQSGPDDFGLTGLVRTFSIHGGRQTRFGAPPQRGANRYVGIVRIDVDMYFNRQSLAQFAAG